MLLRKFITAIDRWDKFVLNVLIGHLQHPENRQPQHPATSGEPVVNTMTLPHSDNANRSRRATSLRHLLVCSWWTATLNASPLRHRMLYDDLVMIKLREGLGRSECPPAAGIHKPCPDLTVKNGIFYSAWTVINGILVSYRTRTVWTVNSRRQKMDSRTLKFWTFSEHYRTRTL